MTIVFKPAVRENISLLIGLAGGTGSGKTKSAMRLAAGMSGGKRFAVIDTERGRAKHYANEHSFDHGDISAPFRPETYVEAIQTADAAGYPVIVVDSLSHEWAGEGGVLDWQEEELYRMAKDDWKRREACKMASWIKPKMAHKQMVQRLLQLRAHVIVCLRAEEKIEMVKGDDGKWQIQPKQTRIGLHGWVPICEKNFPFELTLSILLTSDHPGLPQPIKLEGHHKELFAADRQIDEGAGEALAKWAAGGTPAAPKPESPKTPPQKVSVTALIASYNGCEPGDADVLAELEDTAKAMWSQLTNEQTKEVNAARAAAKKRVSAPTESQPSEA